SGTANYIPIWTESNTLGNSIIYQTEENIWITNGNLNIVNGALKIGDITVIDSSRNIINVNWVNATTINVTQLVATSQICIGNDCRSVWPTLTETDPYWSENISSIQNNYLIKRNSTGISQSIIYDTGTNIGIGTTSPSYKLDIAGDIRGQDNLYVSNSVGIGTTSPVKKLDVVGDINTTGSIYIAGAIYDEGTTYYINPASSGISANLRGDIVLGSGGQIDFYDETGDKIYWYSNIYGTGIESGTLTEWSNSRFRWRIGGTSVSSGSEVMTLTSTGLRIGGGDASYTLHVSKSLNSEDSQIAYIVSNDNVIASQITGQIPEELNWTMEGFKFNSGSYTNIAGVALYIRRSQKAAIDGWIKVRLYSDNNGAPGNILATSQTLYANRISTAGAWYYFGLRYFPLSPNTNYWIIIERNEELDSDDIYLNSTRDISNHVYWDGSTWIPEAKSLVYYVYAHSSRGLYSYTFGSYSTDYGQAIYGYSKTSPGIYGHSESHYGVKGNSLMSWGGYFEGASGIYGVSYSSVGTAVHGYNPGRSGYVFHASQAYSLFTGEGLRLSMAYDVLSKVFYYDGETFSDITTAACQSGGSAFTLLADTDDIMYFGLTSNFTQLQFDIATAGEGLNLVWEYSAGNGVWNILTLSYDETKNLTRSGTVIWSSPEDWKEDSVNGFSAYWIRVRTITSPTRTPTAYIACRSGFTGQFIRGYNAEQEKLRIDSQGRLFVAGEIYPGTLTEEDAIQTLRYIYDTGSAIGINTHFIPSHDNSYDLGSSTNRWRNIYAANIYGTFSPSGNVDMQNYSIYNVNWINATNINVTQLVAASQICIGNDCRTSWTTETISPWDNSTVWTFIREGYPLNVNISNILFVNATTSNVGIGVRTPSQKLTIGGSVGILAGANAFIGTLDNYALSLRTNNVDRIFITDTGKVGIGTTTPTETLHIIGNITIGGNSIKDSSNVVRIQFDATNKNVIIWVG
ncbi:MAG: hypothetical protein QW738_07770, partial [Nitrososphaeria archaeon]